MDQRFDGVIRQSLVTGEIRTLGFGRKQDNRGVCRDPDLSCTCRAARLPENPAITLASLVTSASLSRPREFDTLQEAILPLVRPHAAVAVAVNAVSGTVRLRPEQYLSAVRLPGHMQ